MKKKDFLAFKAIVELVHSYKSGKIGLYSLIQELDSFYRSIEDFNEGWSKVFYDNWSNLESINSHVLAHNISEIPQDFIDSIDVSLGEIEKKTTEVLDEDLLNLKSKQSEEIIDLGDEWLMCPLCEEAWKLEVKSKMIRCPKCSSKFFNPYE
ncbi:hypothetical protein SCG7109_AX_00020 [Chlamydiales bacterium SCGC AG-110-M15]|nr:hypothetical protein SCG7109_AX_00020 [Chlamydiales bacterium SCGC AG-110-M15]